MSFDTSLAHFTTLDSLKNILKTGYIQGTKYKVSQIDIKNFPDNDKLIEEPLTNQDYIQLKPTLYELCLVRKSNFNKISELTDSISEVSEKERVKIIFDIDEIIHRVKYIKKPYPIAELVIATSNKLIENLKNVFPKDYKWFYNNLISRELRFYCDSYKTFRMKSMHYSQDQVLYTEDIVDMWKFHHGKHNNISGFYNYYNDYLSHYPDYFPGCKDFYLLDLEKFKIFMDIIKTYTIRYKYTIRYRECEERLDLTKNNIPLNKDFVKIYFNCTQNELPKDVKEGIKLYPYEIFNFKKKK